MIKRLFTIILLGIAAIGFAGCVSERPANTSIVNSGTANTAKSNTDNPVAVITPTPQQTVNDAPTLKPVVYAYYDALKSKDDAALRRVMAQEFIRSVQTDMKAENRKGMAAYMAELDKVPETPVEVRNEKIQGNRAVAEIKGGAYVNWTPFAFTLENGAWKFTGGSPSLDNVGGSSK